MYIVRDGKNKVAALTTRREDVIAYQTKLDEEIYSIEEVILQEDKNADNYCQPGQDCQT